jgi:hypothetical protein
MRHPSTPAQRVEIVVQLLAHEGEYGVVTRMARAVDASRQTVTKWRAEGRARLLGRDEPTSGERTTGLTRSILTLLVAGHASYRGIQQCLAELRGEHVSLGTICQIIAEAGRRADAVLAAEAPPAPVVVAVDEIFGGAARHGYLNAVDARSGAVWASGGPVVPSAQAWMTVLQTAAAHGVSWAGAVHDGGHAAAGAIAAVTAAVPRQRDIWHVLHRCAQIDGRLHRLVDKAEGRWVSAERYEAVIATGKRPLQRPPTGTATAQAVAVDHLVHLTQDIRYLTRELQRLLEVVLIDHGRLGTTEHRQKEMTALLDLLAERAQTAPEAARAEVEKLHRVLLEVRDGLFVFAAELEQIQRDMAVRLGDAGVALVAWAWSRRAILGDAEALLDGLPVGWRPAARVLMTAWSHTVRASSTVEGWHSVLRPHLAVHRSLPHAFQAILAVAHNHRLAPRGLHAGQSPLHRSGIFDADPDWLTVLGFPATTATRTPATVPGSYPMAA